MDASVEKYDPSRLMEMVRDRIRATYVSLIPEEQWTQMVKKEIDAFFKEEPNTHRTQYVSIFRQVVHSELEKKAREVATSFLSTIQNHEWESGKIAPGEFVKQMFVENSGEILLSVLGSMVQSTINNIRQH